MTGKKLFVSGCLLLSIAAGPARADVVLDWNSTDTQEGRTRTYFNAQGRPFAQIQDTDAFATCP